ncbi:MAG: DUF4214 domain-containing protein [Telluria sp.]
MEHNFMPHRGNMAAVHAAVAPIVGSPGADSLIGTAEGDVIQGLAGNDYLEGRGGNDRIEGGDGDDRMTGDEGDDTLIGGDGNDYMRESSDARGSNTLLGGSGNDSLETVSTGTNLLDGGEGDDNLHAGHGNDVLLGGAGNDWLGFDSWRFDQAHAIRLSGGAGDDRIQLGYAGKLVSVLVEGGSGADRFEFSNPAPNLVIADFSAGEGDTLSLLSMTPVDEYAGNPFGALGYLKAAQSGDDVHLFTDIDGAAGTRAGFELLAVLAKVQLAALGTVFGGGIDAFGMNKTWRLTGTAGPDQLSGGPLDDQISGGDGNDYLGGGTGVDRLDGGAGRDQLDGGRGNDWLTGGAGDDGLNGGDGLDHAVYAGKRVDYVLTNPAFNLTVTDQRAGPNDGVDRLDGIERIHFSDGALAFDTAAAAGQAYRIYSAAFDRTPDEAGLGFWIATMDRGSGLAAVAAQFIGSNEFTALYGPAPTDAQFVDRLYRNILDRAPEQSGFDYWLGVLAAGRADRAAVLAAFSESTENRDVVASTDRQWNSVPGMAARIVPTGAVGNTERRRSAIMRSRLGVAIHEIEKVVSYK